MLMLVRRAKIVSAASACQLKLCLCQLTQWNQPQRRRLHRSAVTSEARQESKKDSLSGQQQVAEEPWLNAGDAEVERYESGHRKLAGMMGRQADTFTEKDVSDALRYLLPSRLTAADARPLLKHPSKIFDKRKESAFDSTGRPLESAFFTGFPAYHNLIYQIYEMREKLEGQGEPGERGGPGGTVEESGGGGGGDFSSDTVPKFWVRKKTMANILAEEISDEQYNDLASRLSKLAAHPSAATVSDFLDRFRRPHFAYRGSAHRPQLDQQGQARAVGRRKASTAVVHVRRGEGEVTLNGQTLLQYFPQTEHQQQVMFPLVATAMLGAVDITAQVKGGGKTGQAGAIRLAVSKALLALPGEHGKVLEEAGLLVRDPRAVERKKPGQKKARKKFTWVKR